MFAQNRGLGADQELVSFMQRRLTSQAFEAAQVKDAAVGADVHDELVGLDQAETGRASTSRYELPEREKVKNGITQLALFNLIWIKNMSIVVRQSKK